MEVFTVSWIPYGWSVLSTGYLLVSLSPLPGSTFSEICWGKPKNSHFPGISECQHWNMCFGLNKSFFSNVTSDLQHSFHKSNVIRSQLHAPLQISLLYCLSMFRYEFMSNIYM